MGRKNQKTVRRTLDFYRVHHGMTSPYRVLCDGTFLHYALVKKLFLKETLPKLFSGAQGSPNAFPCATACVVAELQRLGEDFSGTALMAKRSYRISCPHAQENEADGSKAGLVPAAECIAEVAGSGNPEKVWVATRDAGVMAQLREQGDGAPLVLLNPQDGSLTLEKPSPLAREAAANREAARRGASDGERRVLDAIVGDRSETKRKFKRRKAKGPNPLSVKKKKAR